MIITQSSNDSQVISRIKYFLKLTDIMPPIFAKQIYLDAKYIYNFGGKGSGKSNNTTKAIVILMLEDPHANVMVIKKYNKDHVLTTYKQFRQTITEKHDILMKNLNYNFLKDWKFVKSPHLMIEYIPTGQHIAFVGLDDPARIAGLVDADPKRWYRYIMLEEPNEVSDETRNNVITNEAQRINWEAMEDTILRPPLWIDPKNSKPKVFINSNSWGLLNSWPFEKWIWPNTFKFDAEEINQLLTRGYVEKTHSEFDNGAGAYLCFVAYPALNNWTRSKGWADPDKIAKYEFMKKTNWDLYKLVVLGIPTVSESKIFYNIAHKIKYLDIKEETRIKANWKPFAMGLDIGQLHDDVAIELIQFKKIIDIDNPNLTNWDFSQVYFSDEFSQKANKDLSITSKNIVEWLNEIRIKYNISENQKINMFYHKAADEKIIKPLKDALREFANENNVNFNWFNLVPGPEPNLMENRIVRRIVKWKTLIYSNALIISTECPKLYKTLINTEIDNNGKRIEDRRVIDYLNAAEHPLNYYWLTIKRYIQK